MAPVVDAPLAAPGGLCATATAMDASPRRTNLAALLQVVDTTVNGVVFSYVMQRGVKFERSASLSELCKQLSSELFRPCLSKVLEVVFDLLASHWRMAAWHEEQLGLQQAQVEALMLGKEAWEAARAERSAAPPAGQPRAVEGGEGGGEAEGEGGAEVETAVGEAATAAAASQLPEEGEGRGGATCSAAPLPCLDDCSMERSRRCGPPEGAMAARSLPQRSCG